MLHRWADLFKLSKRPQEARNSFGMVTQGTDKGMAALGQARLAACPYHALRTVLCEFQHGILTLRGRVPSFFHKQLAQEAVGGMAGVRQVVNQIEVSSLPNW